MLHMTLDPNAILEQGIAPELLEMWKGVLDRPVKFLTGGGIQQSSEAVNLWTQALGSMQVHLLKDCPLAMSIRRQVRQGRTFVGTWKGSLHCS